MDVLTLSWSSPIGLGLFLLMIGLFLVCIGTFLTLLTNMGRGWEKNK